MRGAKTLRDDQRREPFADRVRTRPSEDRFRIGRPLDDHPGAIHDQHRWRRGLRRSRAVIFYRIAHAYFLVVYVQFETTRADPKLRELQTQIPPFSLLLPTSGHAPRQTTEPVQATECRGHRCPLGAGGTPAETSLARIRPTG